jgi:hemerythrin-like metal-binding protein
MGVEVKTLDDEHRRLAELIQELQDAIKKRLDIGEVSRIFTRISEGARAHCISEEDILAENKYPQLEEHREAHRKWLEEIKALHLNLRNGQMSHSLAPGKLEIWFAEHIVHEDRKYASYLRARNV